MSLTKQNLDIIFNQGVDNKTDDTMRVNASLRSLENRVFNKIGRLDKRNGLSSLSNIDFNNIQIPNMSAISKFNEKELVLFANESLYSYSPGANKWQFKDDIQSADISIDSIVDGPAQQQDIDSCYANNITLYTWVDAASDDIMAALYDYNSKTVLTNQVVVSTTGEKPRCLTLGNNLFVFYADGTALKYVYVSSADPNIVNSGTISATFEDLHADGIFDVTAIGNTGYVFYKGDTSNTIQVLSFNTAAQILTNNTLTATVIDCLALHTFTSTDGFPYIALAYKETASVVRSATYTQNLIVENAIATIDATASTAITAITINNIDDTIYYFYECLRSPTSDSFIRYNTRSLTTGTAGTSAVFLRSVGLASRAFRHNGTIYLNVLHDSEFQATVFTVDLNTNVITTIAQGRAGSLVTIWAPPSVNTLSNNIYDFAINIKGVIRSENQTLFSLLGLGRAQIDFNGPYIYNSVSINDNMLFIGGNVFSYDGTSVVESGFHLFPETITQTDTATSGGYMSDGSYLYTALYSWVDARGNIHKSAPSIPISVILSGGGSTQTAEITVPTLRVTRKSGFRGDCTIELYRTEADGTIFYKVTSITSPVYNDPTLDFVEVTDTLADSSIISNEILYITGGVLENIAPPAAKTIITHSGRIFLAGLENPNEIRYSKIIRPKEGAAFNEALSIFCDPIGGDITALGTMDGKLVIFKTSRCYATTGDGPSDAGVGNNYNTPELISTDVGCIDGNSVVLGPDGLFFKSAKGIYLLDRTLNSVYIGAQVEDFNSESITSSTLLTDKNEVRFSTDGGHILVYNYLFKQWSVLNTLSLEDSLIYNGQYTGISTNQTVYEDPTSFKDQGSYVNSKISTGWIRLSSVQGFQRVNRIGIIGRYNSPHHLKLTIYNDYSEVPVQEVIFDITEESVYGTGVYGDDIYGTTSNGVYQYQVHVKKQKCQAFRVDIEDIYENDESTTGQGADITGLTVTLGLKKGQNKLPSSKSK